MYTKCIPSVYQGIFVFGSICGHLSFIPLKAKPIWTFVKSDTASRDMILWLRGHFFDEIEAVFYSRYWGRYVTGDNVIVKRCEIVSGATTKRNNRSEGVVWFVNFW